MEIIKNKIKAIIFDMDGTILNTHLIWRRVVINSLAEYGITSINPQQEKILKETASGGLFKLATVLKKELNIKESVDNLVAKKINLSRKYMGEQKIEFINGFEDFHKKLQQHLILTGVATNADIGTLTFLDQKMKLNSFFGKNLYSMEHVENKAKPDPAVFLHTAEKLKVKPEDCIVFEDSLPGFQAAKAANMKCIAIKNDQNKDHVIHADGAIDNYHQAIDEIKKIILGSYKAEDISVYSKELKN